MIVVHARSSAHPFQKQTCDSRRQLLRHKRVRHRRPWKTSGKYEESRSTGLRLRKVVLLLRQSLKLTPRRYPASDVKFFPYYRGAADFYTVQSLHRADGPSRRGAPGGDGSSIGTNDLWNPELYYETTSTQGLREPNKIGPSKSPAKSVAPAAWRASWYSGCRPRFRKTL